MSIDFATEQNCLWLPPDQPSAALSPAVLFLHGIGERGAGGPDLPRVAAWGLPKQRLQHQPITLDPFLFWVVAPQCPADRTWCDDELVSALTRLLDHMEAHPNIDRQRIAVAGFSMGGIGAFCLALNDISRLSALVSVCGRCTTPDRLNELATLPIWLAFAEDDEIVELTRGSQEVVARLSGCGHLVERRYRLGWRGDFGPHVRTADQAYADIEMYRWLTNQHRRKPTQA